MKRKFQFRISTMLILATLFAIVIGVYLRTNGPGKVSIRSPSGEILVSHDDILFVDWKKQELELRSVAISNLEEFRNSLMVDFNLCVDEDTIYAGRITTPFSSFSIEGPVIVVLPSSNADSESETITVDWCYPARPAPPKSEDPRFSHRVYTSLWISGKFEADDP